MNWEAAGITFVCFMGFAVVLAIAKFSIDLAERKSEGAAAAAATFWILVGVSLMVGLLSA